MTKDIKQFVYETEIKYLNSENSQLKEENKKLNQTINDLFTNYPSRTKLTQLKEQVDNLKQDLQNRCDRCIELNNENEKLKQRISNLVSENTKLQNDLFSEQLIQDETDEYINRLKQELFNLYLKHYN